MKTLKIATLTLAVAALGMAHTAAHAQQTLHSLPHRTFGVGLITSQTDISPSEEFPNGAVHYTGVDVGVGTHLGRFRSVYDWIVSPDLEQGVLVYTGTIESTAANGDIMSFEFHLTSPLLEAPVPFTGELIITGGTGAFDGATGVLETEGVNVGDGTFTYESAGFLIRVK